MVLGRMQSKSPAARSAGAQSWTVILGGAGFIGIRLATLLNEERVPFRIGDLHRSEAFAGYSTECDARRGATSALVEYIRHCLGKTAPC